MFCASTRSATILFSDIEIVGFSRKSASKSFFSSTNTDVAMVAITVAERGLPVRRAISPKHAPPPRDAIVMSIPVDCSLFFTSTLPSLMINIASPGAPSLTIAVFGGYTRSLSLLSSFWSSSGLSDLNNSVLLRHIILSLQEFIAQTSCFCADSFVLP